MLDKIPDMTKEEAMLRLEYLNREIRKHEIVFLLFIFLGILEIVLTITGIITFGVLSVVIVLGCCLACYGIFKYSEPFELEKYLIEIIFGKD
jgi:uncharacterized membrane protein SpoIIM required for sporulation